MEIPIYRHSTGNLEFYHKQRRCGSGWIYGNTLYNNQTDIQQADVEDVQIYDNDMSDGTLGNGVGTGGIKVAFHSPNRPTNVTAHNNRIWDNKNAY